VIDKYGGTRLASQPYSPKGNVFTVRDQFDIMDALENGATKNVVSFIFPPITLKQKFVTR